jgi:antitoxin (DNA-binding transcriptional repressor) of toxin-antitoxin stability system
VTITSHGRPVAELGPVGGRDAEKRKRRQAQARLEAHWAKLEPVIVERWTRDELYERD